MPGLSTVGLGASDRNAGFPLDVQRVCPSFLSVTLLGFLSRVFFSSEVLVVF